MEPKDESARALRDSIAVTGQISPILVRPHPETPGRYQVVFGHRRLRAMTALGRPVRCIVKPLTDRELVIAQSQENSARIDLSFIERGRFALALQVGGLRPRDDYAGAQRGKDHAVAADIGHEPLAHRYRGRPQTGTGRHRWNLRAHAFSQHAASRPVDPLLDSDYFRTARSNERFEMLYAHLIEAETAAGRRGRAIPAPWFSETGARIATIAATDERFALTIDKTVTRTFGEFLIARMSALYEEYRAGPPRVSPFRHTTLR